MKMSLDKQLEQMYQIFKKDHARLREQLIDLITQPEFEDEQNYLPERTGSSIGGLIMDSKIFKIAAGFIIVAITAAVISHFTGSKTSTGIAFGQVLGQIQNSSYTFDLTTIAEGKEISTVKGMVLRPGKLRIDAPQVGVSTIADINTKKYLILFHGQKTAMTEIPGVEKAPQEAGPFVLFARPVENLWNLRDGTEKYLGKKEIDGQPSVGFQVQQDNDYLCEIVVWAHAGTGSPIRVEITISNPKNRSESMTMRMSNFNLNAELDENLFSLEPPEGYTLAYQKTLQETMTTTESTPEAQKIEQSLTFWAEGKEDESVQTLLTVDWIKPIEFSDKMYLFSLTEKGYIALKPEDQKQVMQEITDSMKQIRDISRKIWEMAGAAKTQGTFEKSEKYLNTTLEMGRLINRDPEGLMTAQMMGISIQRKSLNEMAALYTQEGNKEKLQQVQDEIKKVDAADQSFRERIKNLTRG